MPESDKNIPIVYYHSVGESNPAWANNFLTLKLNYFEDQIKYLSKNYNVISLQDYFDIRLSLKPPLRNAVVLTFDDGYLDNWIWAYPLIKKYGVKATIFVSPEFVDPRPVVRPTYDDFLSGEASYEEVINWGYLSWGEMKIMESSGLINIQSHTMSHTKYFTSDILRGFHPGDDSFYAACNEAPERKPYCLTDTEFTSILKKGYPLFKEESAIIARRVKISDEFIDQCAFILKDYDFTKYQFGQAYSKVEKLITHFSEEDELITGRELEPEYQERIKYEIAGSKKIIEQNLGKRVDYICWPHGDTTPEAIQVAFDSGYRGVAAGHYEIADKDPRIFPARIGTGNVRNSRRLTLLRAKFKLRRYQKKFPYYHADKVYRIFQAK